MNKDEVEDIYKDEKAYLGKRNMDSVIRKSEMKQFYDALQGLAKMVMLPSEKVENVDFTQDGNLDGFIFKIRNPFYSALYVSAIVDLKVILNEEKINSDKMTLIIRGQRIKVPNAITVTELYWRFGEIIEVYVEKKGGLKKGKYDFQCDLLYRCYLSYIENAKGSVKQKIIVN